MKQSTALCHPCVPKYNLGTRLKEKSDMEIVYLTAFLFKMSSIIFF